MNATTESERTSDPLTESRFLPCSDGHQLHFAEVPSPGLTPSCSVLFLHGLFSDSRFFLSTQGTGPARQFIDHGLRVMLGELRGHGRSRMPATKPWNWNFDTYVLEDIPRLIDAAANAASEPVFIVTHSMGGYATLASLALNERVRRRVAGVVLMASAVNDYSDGPWIKRVSIPFAAAMSHALGRLPARTLKLGPSPEPHGVLRQFADWAAHGRFDSADATTDYWKVLHDVKVPVLSFIGSGDTFHASPKRAERLVRALGSTDVTFIEAGREAGYSRDFGHIDLVRGNAAAVEIIPLAIDWILARAHSRPDT